MSPVIHGRGDLNHFKLAGRSVGCTPRKSLNDVVREELGSCHLPIKCLLDTCAEVMLNSLLSVTPREHKMGTSWDDGCIRVLETHDDEKTATSSVAFWRVKKFDAVVKLDHGASLLGVIHWAAFCWTAVRFLTWALIFQPLQLASEVLQICLWWPSVKMTWN